MASTHFSVGGECVKVSSNGSGGLWVSSVCCLVNFIKFSIDEVICTTVICYDGIIWEGRGVFSTVETTAGMRILVHYVRCMANNSNIFFVSCWSIKEM